LTPCLTCSSGSGPSDRGTGEFSWPYPGRARLGACSSGSAHPTGGRGVLLAFSGGRGSPNPARPVFRRAWANSGERIRHARAGLMAETLSGPRWILVRGAELPKPGPWADWRHGFPRERFVSRFGESSTPETTSRTPNARAGARLGVRLGQNAQPPGRRGSTVERSTGGRGQTRPTPGSNRGTSPEPGVSLGCPSAPDGGRGRRTVSADGAGAGLGCSPFSQPGSLKPGSARVGRDCQGLQATGSGICATRRERRRRPVARRPTATNTQPAPNASR
jgi:hypothetical protein